MGIMEGKVAIVTGAGRGVGRGVALDLARAGAAVVVNDLGVSLAGAGDETPVAEQVARGNSRLSADAPSPTAKSVASWQGAQRIVEAALDSFGRIDGVVNNAGNLRDSLFHKMTEEEFDAVIARASQGLVQCQPRRRAAFQEAGVRRLCPHDLDLGADRQFRAGELFRRQARRSSALSKSIALDMQRFNVRSNAVAPFAWTRMIELDPDQHARAAEARRGPEEACAGEDRAFRHCAAQRRGRGRHRVRFSACATTRSICSRSRARSAPPTRRTAGRRRRSPSASSRCSRTTSIRCIARARSSPGTRSDDGHPAGSPACA